MKFAFLVGVTIVLAGAFAMAVNAPRVTEAQQGRPVTPTRNGVTASSSATASMPWSTMSRRTAKSGRID